MEAFYSFNERFAKIRSQRIKKAVKGIAGAGSTVLSDNANGDKVSRSKSRNRLKKKAPEGRRGKATARGRPKSEEREASNDEPPLREARKSDRRRRRVNYAEDNAENTDVGALDEAGSELDSAFGELFDHGGGGFCLEENGNEYKAPGPGCNFAVSGGGLCMMEEDDNSRFREGDSAKLHVLGDPCQNQMKGDDDAIDCEAAAGSSLRAMPSLRRKRRKK